jgi:Tfp pilus assembly protein FimT
MGSVEEYRIRETRKMDRAESGFTLIELAIIIAVILAISAMAIVQLQPTWKGAQANSAMDQVLGKLRYGRRDGYRPAAECSDAIGGHKYNHADTL